MYEEEPERIPLTVTDKRWDLCTKIDGLIWNYIGLEVEVKGSGRLKQPLMILSSMNQYSEYGDVSK